MIIHFIIVNVFFTYPTKYLCYLFYGISSHNTEEGKELGNVHEQEKGDTNVVS